MHFVLFVSLASAGLFVGMLVAQQVGRWIGVRHAAKDPEHSHTGISAVDGALFGLLGLLVAFTFSGAATRFDTRRNLIVDEANAIGTAYRRLDLLPAEARPHLQQLFRQYLDSRLEVYAKLPDLEAARSALARSAGLQDEIWAHAVAAVRMEGALPAAPFLVMPALNQMIDITTTRTMATQVHPPTLIYAMLFAMALASGLLAGFDMARHKWPSWLHMLGFAAVMAAAVFVILDLEYPRLGLVRTDNFDQLLVDLRASMG